MTKNPVLLEIWTLDDGRTGIASQTFSLASAIAALAPARISAKKVEQRFHWPWRPVQPGADMQAPWPDICIGCGRASIPYMKAMRAWSDGQSLRVQLQNPRCDPALFDLVIPPEHDGLEGSNVFPIIGSPVRDNAAMIKTAARQFADKMASFKPPRLAVVLGGHSHHHSFTKKDCTRLLKALHRLSDKQISLLVTTSRRTPAHVVGTLRKHFAGKDKVWLWCDEASDGPNPYFAFLHAADAVLVTSDSTNMLTEAASIGRPVLLFRLHGGDNKFEHFYDSLARRGLVHPFTGSLATWPVTPLNETRRAAEETLRCLHHHRQESGRSPAP